MNSVGISNHSKTLTAFVVIFLSSFASIAQEEIKPKIKFHHLKKELNNNQVSSIFRDTHGFVWIGTLGGLHRFDGEDFELFISAPDSTSLADTRIERIYEDRHGKLWIGTYEGI